MPDNLIKLEQVGLDSVELLSELLEFSFVDAYRDEHTQENIETYCSQHYDKVELEKIISDPTYDIFFANKAGREVGVLVLHHHSCPLRPELRSSELKQLYVLSSEYGTGLGKYLMEQSFKLVCDSNNEWMWLCVSDLNYRAQRFYQKMNFEKIGQGPILEVGTDRLASSIMLRPLP